MDLQRYLNRWRYTDLIFGRLSIDCQLHVLRFLPARTVFAVSLTTSDTQGRCVFSVHSLRYGLYCVLYVIYPSMRDPGLPHQVHTISFMRLAWRDVPLPGASLSRMPDTILQELERGQLGDLPPSHAWDAAFEEAPLAYRFPEPPTPPHWRTLRPDLNQWDDWNPRRRRVPLQEQPLWGRSHWQRRFWMERDNVFPTDPILTDSDFSD